MSAIWTAEGTGEDAGLDIGIEFAPLDTVALDLNVWDDEGNRVELTIDRDEATGLRDALTAWLCDTPDTAA